MARDKTFSDADIIRIFSSHLSQEEQISVVCFFRSYIRAQETLDSRQLIQNKIVREIVGYLIRLFPVTSVLDRLIDLFSDQQTRLELRACEKRNAQAFERFRPILPDINELIVNLVTGGIPEPFGLLPPPPSSLERR